ncbi:tape measure protein, partial [Alicyclobacillus contaminans]|uniref:tape measure protein n=1 Tax=Alicyclobacillus contaminans TaxID=392016 RepID=UPI00047E1BE7
MSQEVMDIFVSFGINMDNFNDGITKINRQMKLVESEFQAAAAKLGDFGKSSDSLRLQVDALTQKIDLQQQKVAAYEKAIQSVQDRIEKHRQSLAAVAQQLEQARAEYDAVSASMGKDSAEAKALSDQIEKLEKDYKAKIQTLQSDDKALDNNRIKLNNARTALAELENELRQASTGTDRQASSLKSLSDSAERTGGMFSYLGNAVKSALVFTGVYQGINGITSALKNAATAGIQFDSEMQQAQIGFTTLLGSAKAAQDMLQQLADFAQSTPFDLTGVENAAKQMLAMGFSAKEILPDMKAIGDAAAALGLQTDGIQRITLALGQLKTHGVVDAQDMLQLTEAGIPAWNILAQAIGKTVPQLQAMVSKGLVPADQATEILIQGMEQRFPNMLQKMNSSFTSQMGNLKDGLNRALGDAMKPTFDWLTNTALPMLNDKVNTFRQTLEQTGSLSQAFKTIIPPNAVNDITAAVNAAKSLFTTLYNLRGLIVSLGAGFAAMKITSAFADISGITKFITAFNELKKSTVELTAAQTAWQALMKTNGIAAFIGQIQKLREADKDLTVAQAALNAVMDANPIGAIAAAIGALIAAGAALYAAWKNDWGGIQEKTAGVIQVLKSMFSGLANFVVMVFDDVRAGVLKAILAVMNAVSPVVGLIGDVAPGVAKAFNGVRDAIKASADDITNQANQSAAEMQAAFNNMRSVINNGMEETNWGNDTLQDLQRKAGQKVPIGSAAMPLPIIAPTKATTAATTSAIKTSFANVASGSKSAAQSAGQSIAQSFIDGLQKKLAGAQQTIDQLQARLQFRKDQGNTAAVTETTQELVNAYKAQMNQLQSAMNSISAEIKKLNPKKNADDIAQLKDQYSQLAVQWWNDRDALTQLTAQADQATTTVTNLLNAADNATSATDKQIQTLQAQMQYLKDAGQDTSSVAKQIGDTYSQELKSIQSSINSLQTELKKLNPKTQADLVQQVKDKIADLNTEL